MKKGQEKPSYILRLECDVSMARQKGYLPCDHQCRCCHACIITYRGGQREHVNNIVSHNIPKQEL